MSEYPNRLESVDIEIYQLAKAQKVTVKCVSCADVIPEDGHEEWHFISDDVWCHQCVIDADLIGHTYG
jgi:hypothetical protein